MKTTLIITRHESVKGFQSDKKWLVFTLMISFFFITNSQSKEATPIDLLFSLKASSTWREFTNNPSQRGKKTSDKRVLIGEIKIKSKEIMFLDELKASWCGGNIGKMVASLYSKKITDRRSPIPIDDNLICDGTWNPVAKEFVFPVNKKLVASDTYYLMLHVPKKFESQLKVGSFKIQGREQCAMLSLKKP